MLAPRPAPAPIPLGNEQLQRYLHDGFVALQPPDMDAECHAALFEAACQVHNEARAVGGHVHLQVIGDNLRARIPILERLLDSPTVRGALASVLGEDYLLHPHHFVHEATTNDQSFHQDGNLPWNDRAHYRTHRPNWAMLFYYPQAVTLASGPTEVLAGTQYWTTDFEKPDGTWHRGDAVDKTLPPKELASDDLAARDRRIQAVADSLGIVGLRRHKIELPAGSVVLAHYDLMHRGSRVAPAFNGRRFMYKFYFLRTRDPRRAANANTPRKPPTPTAPTHEADALAPIVETLWHWLHGDSGWRLNIAAADQIERIQTATAEDERVRLAYEIGWLARDDAKMRAQLGKLLQSDVEAVRRTTAYAAGIVGPASQDIVLDALANPNAPVRRAAAYAAGEARLHSAAAIGALFERLENDSDDLVRSNAAYALGNIARVAGAAVSAPRLLARLAPGVEPDNTTNGGMARSTVRVNVLYALCNMTLNDAELTTLAHVGLADHDRYVQGLAAALLERHAECLGNPWLQSMIAYLGAARFNPPPAPLPSPVADRSVAGIGRTLAAAAKRSAA